MKLKKKRNKDSVNYQKIDKSNQKNLKKCK